MATAGFIVSLIIFFILFRLNSFVRELLKQNKDDIINVNKTLYEIQKKLNSIEIAKAKTEEPKSEEQQPESTPLEAKAEEKIETEKVEDINEVLETKVLVVDEVKDQVQTPVFEREIESKKVKSVESIITSEKHVKSESFFEKHPDFEKFIGENLINKIGIVILILGIGFFVKYAIDNNWINEIGRVAIGILSAGILIGVAHKLRNTYKAFGSVLIGGGLALLYYIITLAYHTEGYPLYQQQTIAFVILIFITVFAVFLSVLYDRIEIAIIAIIGGFSSPLMLSNGSGNYVTLFTYVSLLNIGMLVLSYHKKWRLVNIVAFAFTVLLFGSWLSSELIHHKYSSFNGAIFFATGFYIIFFLMNIIYNIKHNISFKVRDISLLLSNTFIYFSFVMLMLTHINEGAYKGLFSILLAAFNFGFAYFTHARQKTDTNLLYLLIGLVFTFVTLAIPLQLKGNYITLFWSIESVLLLWLGQKSGAKIMKLGAILVAILMLISILMDWSANYHVISYSSIGYVKQLGFLINKMSVTSLISGGALIALFLLLKKEKENTIYGISVESCKSIILGTMLAIFYIGGILEINYQAHHYFIEYSSQTIVVFTYNALFMLLLLVFARKANIKVFSKVISVLSTLFVFAFLISISNAYAEGILNTINKVEALSSLLLLFRWVSILSVYGIGFLLYRLVDTLNSKAKDALYKLNITFFVFTIVYLLSADLDALGILISKSSNALAHTQKTGYAILWGLSSFALMIIGMKRKLQVVRILSLILLSITIAKLFIYDISNISEGGKIVAFILLGVLLLIISFMYQKVKKLIIEDNGINTSAENNNERTN